MLQFLSHTESRNTQSMCAHRIGSKKMRTKAAVWVHLTKNPSKTWILQSVPVSPENRPVFLSPFLNMRLESWAICCIFLFSVSQLAKGECTHSLFLVCLLCNNLPSRARISSNLTQNFIQQHILLLLLTCLSWRIYCKKFLKAKAKLRKC